MSINEATLLSICQPSSLYKQNSNYYHKKYRYLHVSILAVINLLYVFSLQASNCMTYSKTFKQYFDTVTSSQHTYTFTDVYLLRQGKTYITSIFYLRGMYPQQCQINTIQMLCIIFYQFLFSTDAGISGCQSIDHALSR